MFGLGLVGLMSQNNGAAEVNTSCGSSFIQEIWPEVLLSSVLVFRCFKDFNKWSFVCGIKRGATYY